MEKRRITDLLRIGNTYSLGDLVKIVIGSGKGYKVSAVGNYSLDDKKEIKRVNGSLDALVAKEKRRRKKRELISMEIKFCRCKRYPVKLGEEEYFPNFRFKFYPFAGEYRLISSWGSLSDKFEENFYGRE